jgi:hypothetical protein
MIGNLQHFTGKAAYSIPAYSFASAVSDCRGYGADAHLLVTAVVMALPALLAVLDHLARCWIVLAPRTLGRPQRHSVDDSVA